MQKGRQDKSEELDWGVNLRLQKENIINTQTSQVDYFKITISILCL